ncbi:molybdopterin-guanine dinucleotide biosynthesis protein B [Geomicrobium halophilum]|uniref:Molybdopterin-guanine dinucleotide biosynthesis protein B n=1 Tax=Geomicrobium halophilum TaxID=549000 RepID=A0A841PZ39_9BACL|nr:molybdopterin-guanine dinucleotide biosynthesis protein B [Geomicrobium halophilum]MBB6450093.1 molybdopterin-guanine dinucleotide biosynthesis protein B [Geomicrobium halophilum]
MGKHCRVLQVVGFKHAGKTTVMERLVQALSMKDMRVATLKHHGHGGELVPPEPQTDSERLKQAGAVSSAVEGEGMLQLSAKTNTWSLNQLLRLQARMEPDVVLVEGWKHEDYKKVVLLRGREDEELLAQVRNICCVLYWGDHPQTTLPSFSLDEDPDVYMRFIVSQVEDSYEFKFI